MLPAPKAPWRREWLGRQRRIHQRLDKHRREPGDGLSGEPPVLQGSNLRIEMGERHGGTAFGGVDVIHQLVRALGLAEPIDERLELLKLHMPYYESDHVLNFAFKMDDKDSQEIQPPTPC